MWRNFRNYTQAGKNLFVQMVAEMVELMLPPTVESENLENHIASLGYLGSKRNTFAIGLSAELFNSAFVLHQIILRLMEGKQAEGPCL